MDELQSTRDGRFKGDGERDGISQDRQASVGGFGALADLDTKWGEGGKGRDRRR